MILLLSCGNGVADDLLFMSRLMLESALPSETVSLLKVHVPDKLKVPSGSLIRIHYPLDKNPYVEVRIQEVFGLQSSPRIFKDSIPSPIS